MDVTKQIVYWINSADDDLNTSEILINNNKLIHGLFFCHLCIEKSIKAHVVRCTQETPPKIHKLSYLLSLTDLNITEENKDLCAILMNYMLEGRYPDYSPFIPTKIRTIEYFNKTKLFYLWLKAKL